MTTQLTAFMRDRGQITIPDKLRATYQWLNTGSVLAIYPDKGKIILAPYENQKTTDWKGVWEKIELTKSFNGKNGNLAKFIAKDRYRH